ncbi:uncharacterized protein LOC135596437 [Musa acuminata AAA Group]|uniref:uncharacterized protein LOC135596437 n=1 Tax=Musa acuminata AAA Group TaxID=214697 RepID=UPI0031DA458F
MQQPVHYVSHVLRGPKICYPPIERLALALVLTAQKLRPYFQAHTIRVVTDQPLRQTLSNFDTSGRMLQWSVELNEFDIQYSPRTTVKAQVLADFISELMPEDQAAGRRSGRGTWTLHVDGSSTSEGAGVSFVLKGYSGEAYERSLQLKFRATNNEAEYEALLHGLRLALELHVGDLEVFSDSQLVTGHINGSCEARDPTMISYLVERADALAKSASTRTPESVPTTESMVVLTIPTHEVTETNLPPNWIEEILRYKAGGKEPDDPAAARWLRRTRAWYCIIGGRLYRRAFSQPLLCCLAPSEAEAILAELHEGICREHVEAEPLASITKRHVQNFTWRNIITRFGIPRAIITDNGTQFNNSKFKAYYQSYGIQLKFSSVAHPQTNGQTEVMNRAIIEGLIKRISGAHRAWVDELPSVLWAMRTTPKAASGESSFSLAYGTEAVPPPEMEFPTLHTSHYERRHSEEGLRANLDLLEERRAEAHLRTLAYKKATARMYNRRVCQRPIQVIDLVLRKTEVSNPAQPRGKLTPNWEGPYQSTTWCEKAPTGSKQWREAPS